MLGTPQRTIADWLRFSETAKPDHSSPTPKPDPELDRLRKELADRERFEKEQEEETQKLRAELETLKNTPLSEPEVIVLDRLVPLSIKGLILSSMSIINKYAGV